MQMAEGFPQTWLHLKKSKLGSIFTSAHPLKTNVCGYFLIKLYAQRHREVRYELKAAICNFDLNMNPELFCEPPNILQERGF